MKTVLSYEVVRLAYAGESRMERRSVVKDEGRELSESKDLTDGGVFSSCRGGSRSVVEGSDSE